MEFLILHLILFLTEASSILKKAIKHVEKMIENGADIIDIGAVSSRPFSKNISFSRRKNRLFPYLKEIIKKFPDITLSVDTFRSEIAKIAIDSGATIINDIYGEIMIKTCLIILLKIIFHIY